MSTVLPSYLTPDMPLAALVQSLRPDPVAGWVRLALELGFFALATAALLNRELTMPAVSFAAVVLMHYAISYDRIIWLLQQ